MSKDYGELGLTDSGLSLPIDVNAAKNAPAPALITSDDMRALSAVTAEINSRWPETRIDPTLDRMTALMDLLGEPQRAYPSIHVAGTNGKTSTVRMIEALLRGFHRRTGRSTSPHLQLVTERIAIDGEPIHPRDFVRTWEDIKPYVEMVDTRSEVPMSTFEVLTAMGYAAFADAPVDVAVVEVGMGGRWDATNMISADVDVIMPIGLDHTHYLGESIEEIAAEKAGIITPRWDPEDLLTPPDNVVIVGDQEAAARNIVLQRAVDVDAAVARAGVEFQVNRSEVAVGGQMLDLHGLAGDYDNIFLPLSGAHMAHNAACALAAVEAFFGAGSGRQLDVDTVRAAFADVSAPGRLERVRFAPSVFVDASHNPQGAHALAAALSRDFHFRRLVAVVGVFQDKDARGILSHLETVCDDIVVTMNSSPRALDVDELAVIARSVCGDERVHVEAHLPTAIERAIELAEDTTEMGEMVSGSGVVVTGSVVTAGEARALFGKEPS